MGDHVFVGDRSIVSAAVVGSYVYIGKDVVIVSNFIFHDTSKINFVYQKNYHFLISPG